MIRRTTLALFVLLAAAACGGDDKKSTLDASTPKALAESIFAIAKSGDLALLSTVADPVEADGDSKQLAAVAQAPAERQAEFRKHFGPGKVSGDVMIEGDTAAVPILFGPDGTLPETFNMVKRGDRWHLQNF